MYRGPAVGLGAGGAGGLAYTGFDTLALTVVALVLLVAGLALVRSSVVRSDTTRRNR